MHWFPIFLSLTDASCLVVGGGGVALRKTKQLVAAGARVTVVAPRCVAGFNPFVGPGRVERLDCGFEPAMVAGRRLVIAASGDPELNREVAEAAQRHGVLVNVVDGPRDSSFISPAIIERAGLTVAVASDGRAPILAREVKTQLEAILPAELGRLVELIARWRETAVRCLPSPMARRRFWDRVIRGPVARYALAGDAATASRLIALELERSAGGEISLRGEVYIVGGGPGDPELLTLRALKLMQTCDVVLHDSLVTPEILALVRRDAERINVGKRRGVRGLAQEQINAMMIALAGEGKRVLRLKGGDPLIFGRGGEEMEALARAGVPYQVVPGITAATGCAASADIPLTHRDHAHSCVLVAGHQQDGSPDIDWKSLASSHQTLVFYMSFANVAGICERLVNHGLSQETPAALVACGTRRAQKVLTGSIVALPAIVEEQRPPSPAILIVGEVVRLRDGLRKAPALSGRGEAGRPRLRPDDSPVPWLTWLDDSPVL